ncbi:unnamed protein product [Mytilus edulis]|uniref:Uncharacterized protein n=1 Tax=Mytilus edulis TaxID=6550 RepID=A0A8S3VDE0_MYTED|nr:unnamed protein product [Mytilus edulis]
MGLTSSSHKDVNVVQSVDNETLLSAISALLNKRKLSNKDPKSIAQTAMQFLQQSVEVKHKDMVISEILEEVRSNSEVLVWFEDIGQVSIKSGQRWTQNSDTWKLDVRNFVQSNSVDWKNASINFDGIFPLTLTSGNGSHRFDLHEILANSKTVATGNLELMQQVYDEMKEKFENRNTEELLKTEAPFDKQLREAGNDKLRENEMRQKIKKLKTNLHEVDNEARIILKQHHEIKTMIDTEKKLQKQLQEEESNLAKFERKLKDTKSNSAKLDNKIVIE